MRETFDTVSSVIGRSTIPAEPAAEDVPRPFLLMLIAGMLTLIYVAYPVRTPLFLATVLAVVGRPLFYRLSSGLGGRPRLTGAIMTVGLLALIVIPVILLGSMLLREITEGLAWLRVTLGLAPEQQAGTQELLAKCVDKLATVFKIDHGELRGYMSRAMQMAQRAVPAVITASMDIFGKAFLLLMAFYFLTVDGHWLTHFVGRMSPLRPAQTHELIAEFRNVASGAVLGNAVNAALQGVALFTGFYFAGIPHAGFLGIVSVPAALIPLVGSQLVWTPAMALLLFQGRYPAAVLLAVWCTVIVLIIDNVIKPWVLKGKVEFHSGLLLLGFIGGIAMFGLPGLIAGPLAVTFALTLFRIYQRDYLARGVVTRVPRP